jgi:glutamine amidotransferase
LHNAFKFIGYNSDITSEIRNINRADVLLLPGVGSFNLAIKSLKRLKLLDAINDHVKKERKILGICLGMQIMAKVGYEHGITKGLGIIDAEVKKIKNLKNYQLPHVGFNKVKVKKNMSLFKNIEDNSFFYFNHSFAIKSILDGRKFSQTFHGEKFISSYESKNIFATQFHPEKSQTNGLQLLKNFISI